MSTWTWPVGLTIVLFQWSWADAPSDRLVHGWSLVGAANASGGVLFEAERGKPPMLHQIGRSGAHSTERHIFASAAELPLELRDDDGQPITWLRQLISARATFRANLTEPRV